MLTKWQSKAARTMVMHRNGKSFDFHRGTMTTADKDDIKKLLHSQEFERGDIENVTPMEHIQEYLQGKEPDKLTEEILDGINPDGLRRLATHLSLNDKHGGYPEVIKVMAKGKYIDDKVQQIINEYKSEDAVEKVREAAEEAGVIFRDGPWYKFQTEGMEKPDSITRSPVELEKWCVENKSKVKEAIDNALQSKEKEEG